jgi:hypothetical protein
MTVSTPPFQRPMLLTAQGAAGPLSLCSVLKRRNSCIKTFPAPRKWIRRSAPKQHALARHDFLLVLAKKAENTFSTWSLPQRGQVIFGFASCSLKVRKTMKSFLQSLQT